MSAPSSKMRNLVGEYVNIEDTATCRVGDAVEIAADAHHAFMGEAPFELQHHSMGTRGLGFSIGFSSAKASLTMRCVVACGPRGGKVSSQRRSWMLRSSRLRNDVPRKKSSRM